jgi:hypothetical protein
MRSRDFQDWSRDNDSRRSWRDRPSDEEGEERRYRGRESYEQQYRGGQGGMSDMWDRSSYPRNQERGGRDSGYGSRESWDQRYRAGEDDRYAEPDYDRGRPGPERERGSFYGYGREERGGGDEPQRSRWSQQNRDFGYANRLARDNEARRGFGSGSYDSRGSFGGGAYEGGYGGEGSGPSGYGRGGSYGYEGNSYGAGFGGGMSLDDGRFTTRSSYTGGQPPRRSGNAPKGYKRSDDRIREDVCDRLSERWDVESQGIEVSVSNGEVTLSGSVPERAMKFRAENISDSISGVVEVHNQLRVAQPGEASSTSPAEGSRPSTAQASKRSS